MPTDPPPRLETQRDARDACRAQRALAVAAATSHDAVSALNRAGVRDGQLLLARAAAALLEIAQDHPTAADYGPSATAEELLHWIIGATLTREN